MRKIFVLFATVAALASCTKETSLETGNPPTQPGGGGGGGNPTTCGTTVMKIKKLQSLITTTDHLSVDYTAGGLVDKIIMNLPFSGRLTGKMIYDANNRVKEIELIDHINGNVVWDTVVYRYNAAGKIDSMYNKGGGLDRSLKYDAAGKLIRLTRHDNGGVMYYFDITSDAKGNITKAVEWWNNGSGFDKESTFSYSRDDKKNPFEAMAPYMLYLDDEYAVFRHWGANNYVDQTYEDHTTPGLIIVTGWKNRYNANCYPIKAQNTISGVVLFPNDDDWDYIY